MSSGARSSGAREDSRRAGVYSTRFAALHICRHPFPIHFSIQHSTFSISSMSHILVVEDDDDIAALIAHYLEKAGHRVERADVGRRRPAQAPRRRRADLVILDLMLPGMDGLLVCQAMRADPSIAGIPIIMLTARGEEADRVIGPRARRRRLRHQAVQPEGARRARHRAAAPQRAAPARRRAAALRAHRDRRRPPHRRARRRGGPADGEGVPAAAVPRAAPGPGPLARPAAQRRLGLQLHWRHAHGRRPHPAAAREAAAAVRRRSRPSSSSATSCVDRAVTLPHPTLPDVSGHGRADAARRHASSSRGPCGATIERSDRALAWSARPGSPPKRCRIGRRRRPPSSTAKRTPSAGWSVRASRFIAPDGIVLGDSELDGAALAALENHATRPEIQQARAGGARHRAPLQHDRPDRHAVRRGAGQQPGAARPRIRAPGAPADRRRRAAGRRCAGSRSSRSASACSPRWPLAWATSDAAQPARPGDCRRSPSATRAATGRDPARDYGNDEIGTRRARPGRLGAGNRPARDRSRRPTARGWKPSSSGMIEGVLVVNDHGRRAARQRRRAPHAAGCRTTPKAATTSRSCASPTSPRSSARRCAERRPRASS